ncbi:fiber-2 [Simian adenovirus 16]|uniref:Fiber-2 n=1 Tax=Simian adenovirus 16 TaxID=1715778 RepID=A0A0M4NFQ3_9ADEN|nr:fiber-2 [Simian adenovirus 16]ALE30412.1 fiber-2 [Simian adenovirus 16]
MKRARSGFNPVYPYPPYDPPIFITPPFTTSQGFQESPAGVLALKLGSGLLIDEQGEITATYRETRAPLADSEGTLFLMYSSPFTTTSNGSLSLQAQHPLQVGASSLLLLTTPPIAVGSSGLTLNLGQGLEVQNSQLSLLVGDGLKLQDSLQANPDSTKGLENSNGLLAAKLGSGLQFSDTGAITLITRPDTLWTTADPSPNCTVKEELDCKLSLTLTKNGGMVHGLVGILALKGPLTSIPAHEMGWVTITLTFDESGRMTFGENNNLASSATWGFKHGNSISTEPLENALGFMPNSLAYSRGQGQHTRNNTFASTYMQADHKKPLSLQITFNENETGYSIRFTWMGIFQYQGDQFLVPPCPFSYLSEE